MPNLYSRDALALLIDALALLIDALSLHLLWHCR